MTLRFHVDAFGGCFDWTCYSSNNREMFRGLDRHARFRNCVNQVRVITRSMRPGTHCIVVTRRADELRRANGEPLYGVRSGVCT